MELSIIIPVYNEEKNIEDLYRKILNHISCISGDYEIVYVNDGSTDGTLSVLKQLRAGNNHVKIISFKRNFGQTAAIAAGIESSCGDIVITMDGDGQNDAEDIPRFLDKLNEGYEMVAGWRKIRHDSFFSRRLPSLLANRIISVATNVKLHDNGCTMRAIRREALRDISLYGEMHRFVSILIAWSGAKVAEIPVKHNPRIYGKTNYGIMRTFKVILDLLTLIFLKSYATKPIYIFGGTGIISVIASFVFVSITVYQKLFSGDKLSIINNPLLHLSSLLFLMGTMLILIGLLAELIVRIYYESTNRGVYIIKEKIGFFD
ncbi:glycosyltransferase family 2 protein [Candidatus Magnetominusculus dajiuhuensis]|uniref:glycosyltransferase family 2 protein n=1 Tax=Candidatus Magnetominusculus dajiuhuensis TaxID=3137712 RepID=UPI003B43C4BB